MTDKIKICASCDEDTPVIVTMAFKGCEIWCPRCDAKYGMFDGGTIAVKSTKRLEHLHKELRRSASNYLSARGIAYGGGMQEFGGVLIGVNDISIKKADEIRIRAEAGYSIDVFDQRTMPNINKRYPK